MNREWKKKETFLPGAISALCSSELWLSVINVIFGISSLVGAAILSAAEQPEKCGHKVAVRVCFFAIVMIL